MQKTPDSIQALEGTFQNAHKIVHVVHATHSLKTSKVMMCIFVAPNLTTATLHEYSCSYIAQILMLGVKGYWKMGSGFGKVYLYIFLTYSQIKWNPKMTKLSTVMIMTAIFHDKSAFFMLTFEEHSGSKFSSLFHICMHFFLKSRVKPNLGADYAKQQFSFFALS